MPAVPHTCRRRLTPPKPPRAGFVERFSVARQTWEKCPHMIEQRGSHGAAAIGGRLYAFSGGGVDSNLGTCECMDPTTHEWRYVNG